MSSSHCTAPSPRGRPGPMLGWAMSTLLAAFLASVVLGEERFSVSGPGVSVVRMEAACVGCSWERSTATGAFLVLEVDGVYSRHLVLTRDETPLPEYLVSLGPPPRDRTLSWSGANPATRRRRERER